MQFIHIANSKCSKPHSNMMHDPATCMILMILVILILVVLG